MTAPGSDSGPARPPLLLIRGDATAEEVAALVAVLRAAARPAPPPPAAPRPEWAAPYRMVRRPHRHGPGGWRASALPRSAVML